MRALALWFGGFLASLLSPTYEMSLQSSQVEIAEAVLAASEETGLPLTLLAAVILQESSGEYLAQRHEPNFYARYIRGRSRADIPGYWPPHTKVTDVTERLLRSTSFGLMQVMGQTAREAGFRGEYMAELFIPSVNVKLGAKILKRHIDKFGERGGLLKYNGGGTEGYPDQVLLRVSNGEALSYLGRLGLVV
jgi:soluble lytic murein transglycosylase-like protein